MGSEMCIRDRVKTIESQGGDKPVVKIFWGNDRIDKNSTLINPDDNVSWDRVTVLNGGLPVGLGIQQKIVENLEQDTTYYYRAYAENLGGEAWAPNIESFIAIDTRFTRETMDGLVFWVDASDVDGNNLPDDLTDGEAVPLWIDTVSYTHLTLPTILLV